MNLIHLLTCFTALCLGVAPATVAKNYNNDTLVAFPALAPPPKWIQQMPVRRYSLVFTEGVANASCALQPGAVLVNGSSPGPTLRARRGERLLVNVTNAMPDRNATVHWHGQSALLNPASDGTPLLSQFPIAPGHWFEYSVHIPRTWDAVGTYFYHGHVDLSSMTGFGPLLIEDDLAPLDAPQTPAPDLDARNGASYPTSPYQWDEDRVLAIGDFWAGMTQAAIKKGLLGAPFQWPGSPQAFTINGKQGMTVCNATTLAALALPTPLECPSLDTGCADDFATIHVPFDSRIRVRIIGAQSLMYNVLGIFNHSVASGNLMQIIEADGSYLEPFAHDTIELTSGQRYSWLIQTKTKDEVMRDGTGGVYFIRVESRWRAGPSGWARLVYPVNGTDVPFTSLPSPPYYAKDNSTASVTRLLPNETFGWVTSQLAPLRGYAEDCPSDAEVTRTVILDSQQIAFGLINGSGIRWSENQQVHAHHRGVYVEDGANASYPTPLLVQLLTNLTHAQGMIDRTRRTRAPLDDATLCGLVDCALPGEKERAAAHKLFQGFDNVTGTYVGHPGEVIDIVYVNRPSALSNQTEIHPFHMHSAKSWSVGIWPGTFSFEAYDAKRLARNGSSDPSPYPAAPFARPIPRDTTMIYAGPGAAYLNETVADPATNDGGWSVVRYRVGAGDSGAYIAHCHLAFHLQMGMGVVWAFGIEDMITAATCGPHCLQSPQSARRWQEVLGVQPDGTVQDLSSGYLTYGDNVAAVS